MEISFATRRLQKTCETEKALRRTHGAECAKKAMARLLDLAAAPNLEAAKRLPGRFHELTGDRSGQFALNLSGGKRLVFEPAGNPPPTQSDGGLDLILIETVRVVEIVDYHG